MIEGSSARLFEAFSCAVVMLQRLGGRQLFAIDVTEARMISFSAPGGVLYLVQSMILGPLPVVPSA